MINTAIPITKPKSLTIINKATKRVSIIPTDPLLGLLQGKNQTLPEYYIALEMMSKLQPKLRDQISTMKISIVPN